MKKSVHSDEPITIGERVATAFISAIAAGLTVIAYFVISVAFASKYSGPFQILFDVFFSRISLGIVAAAFVLGFMLGSARMAAVFGSLWGTSEEPTEPWFVKLKATIVVTVIVLVAVHFTHNP